MQIQIQGLVLGKFRKCFAEREGEKDICQSACAASPPINALSPLFLPDSEEYNSSTKQRRHWKVMQQCFLICVDQNHTNFDSVKSLP